MIPLIEFLLQLYDVRTITVYLYLYVSTDEGTEAQRDE